MAKNKQCAGLRKYGIEPHDAPVSAFSTDKSTKDGLDRICKEHNAYYAKAKRQGGLVAVEQPTVEPVVEELPAGESPSATKRREQFEQELAEAGGPGTEAGQALLEREAKLAKRRERRRERKEAAVA